MEGRVSHMAKVRKVGSLVLSRVCARERVSSLHVRNKCEKEGGENERKEETGGALGERRQVRCSNVGDVQVAAAANTLGRLRIMMPYCIQIRIPTVACVSVYGRRRVEIALSLMENERPTAASPCNGVSSSTRESVEAISLPN